MEPGAEPALFKMVLGDKPLGSGSVPASLTTVRPRLHDMRLGDGFLELPQTVRVGARLENRILNTKCVYVLDDSADIWVWAGRRASRLVLAAAVKIAENLRVMLPRPSHTAVFSIVEVS